MLAQKTYKKIKESIVTKSVFAFTALYALSSCDKGGSSFSVLSDTNSYQQSSAFEVKPRKLDVLFVVDNSGSMSTSQNNLANNFSSFIDRFIDQGYDFKIAITTTDTYYGEQFLTEGCSICNVNQTQFRGVIDMANYDLKQQSGKDLLKLDFANFIKVGINGSGDERAFSSFKASLGSPLNLGFHRADAYLAVIIVSDEEDFSSDSFNFTTAHPVSMYNDYLMSFTSGKPATDFSVSTISILDSTCLAQLGAGRKIGTRYMQLADLTGGTKNSLCAPFDTTLDNISSTIETQGQALAVFKLSKKPVVSSIRVIVDSALVPESETEGWVYEAGSNTVKISGNTYKPKPGSSVIINFDPDLN